MLVFIAAVLSSCIYSILQHSFKYFGNLLTFVYFSHFLVVQLLKNIVYLFYSTSSRALKALTPPLGNAFGIKHTL